jgi:uncharacterized protein (TIGR02444 family)
MNTITVSSFWQFSLTLYKNQLLESTLIEFQNKVNGNVNLALLCAMLNQHKLFLTQYQLHALHQSVTDFSKKFTQPLRTLRQTYKSNKGKINEYSQLRQSLLDAELLFEQQEQEILVTELTQIISHHVLIYTSNSDNLALYEKLIIDNFSNKNTQELNLTTKLTDLNQYLS